MSKHKPRFANYIVLVDSCKPPKFKHSTAGRYRVGAKNEKQAEQIVRDYIKFGSVQVYYKDDEMIAGYMEVIKEVQD